MLKKVLNTIFVLIIIEFISKQGTYGKKIILALKFVIFE